MHRQFCVLSVTAAISLAAIPATSAAAPASTPHAAACSDVEVVFARATGETPGLGSAGTPLVSQLAADLPGRSVGSYAVNYAASFDQSSAGPGATDMTRHVQSTAAQCPSTRFVLGGYSQGASVTDIALGIPTTLGRGDTIPTALAGRIAAVVAFGNPLGLSRRTIATASPTYGPKSIEFCNRGDNVCGGTGTGPGYGHLSYPRDGSVPRAAQYAAQHLTGN